MKSKRKFIFLAAVGFLLLVAVGTALALGTASVDWWVFGGGGGSSTGGGDISINDTIGQPVIGLSSGDGVSLQAGYWVSGSGSEPEYLVYLPLVMR